MSPAPPAVSSAARLPTAAASSAAAASSSSSTTSSTSTSTSSAFHHHHHLRPAGAKSTHGHAAKYKAYATIRGVSFVALISWPFKSNGIDIAQLKITVPVDVKAMFDDDEKCPNKITIPIEQLKKAAGEWAIKEEEVTCNFEPIEGGVTVDVRKI